MFDGSILVKAELAARKAWSDSIASSSKSPLGAYMTVGFLQHPIWRHLLEIYLNDSVTAFGAQVLRLAGLVDVREFRARTARFRGREFAAVDLRPCGIELFRKFEEQYEEHVWFVDLVMGITAYACRDAGQGICLGTEHFTSAIENCDRELLSRVVDPLNQSYQFDDIDDLPTLNDEARLLTCQFWSPRHYGRTSASLLLNSIDITNPLWPYDGSDTALLGIMDILERFKKEEEEDD